MAYSDTQLDVPLGQADLTSTSTVLIWTPLGLPGTVRRVAVEVSTAVTTPAAVVRVDRRPVAGSDAGKELGVATLTIPASSPLGTVVYTNVEVQAAPGSELLVTVTTAAGAGIVQARLTLEPGWDVPANNPKMVASA